MLRRVIAYMVLLVLLAACVQTPAPLESKISTVAGPNVWINEIHYDNGGTDSGEAIEIAGPAGTNLIGWQLVRYNGSNGAAYTTPVANETLNVALEDETDGYGFIVVEYPENGLQNGSPDGVALIDATGAVVQFLSYGGNFTAVGGPADGLTSTDIGVAESGSTPVGYSLQLTGQGLEYGDFTWSVQQPETFGEINTGQSFDEPVPPDPGGEGSSTLVINEIDYDQPSTDTAEFIEIKNVSEEVIDLDEYSLVLVNGSNDEIYQDFSLPEVPLAAGDYFVLCGDEATVPNCDLDVSPNSNLIQNGDPDAVVLIKDAEIIEKELVAGEIVDTVSYEGSVEGYTESAGAGGDSTSPYEGISRYPDGEDTDRNNLDFSLRCITPGAENSEASSDCPNPFPTEAFFIHEIQGNGDASPLIDRSVIIEGIVVGDYQDTDTELRGFFVQEEDEDADGNDNTSEGIFVFDNGFGEDVDEGDRVSVTGTVEEFYDLTEIVDVTDVTVQDKNAGAEVTPTKVSLPIPEGQSRTEFWEPYEGMLVELEQEMTVVEYFQLGRFGEIVLSAEGRQYQFTSLNAPDETGNAAYLEDLDRARIILDDYNARENRTDFILHPAPQLSPDNFFRGGDTITTLRGVVDFDFGEYKIQPQKTNPVEFTSENERSDALDPVGGSLKVASFNVLNYFATIDDGVISPEPRGADSQNELERQRAKIVSALVAMDADIVGLIEIENRPDATGAIESLVNGLNAELDGVVYAYIDSGQQGDDAIRQALIYKPAVVTPLGSYAVLDNSEDSRFDDQRNRPVLAQTFMENDTGARFTVAVNHLKSKGSNCNALGDPDLGDGQANCNLTRTVAAEAMADWLADDPTGQGDADALIIGDLNAYAMEDPITALKDAGYTDLLDYYLGEDAYTYVFDGQLGYLDHALANESLVSQVEGATVWHINADEISLFDYQDTILDEGEAGREFESQKPEGLYSPHAYRSSDHDPVLVGLDLEATEVEQFLITLRLYLAGLSLTQDQADGLFDKLAAVQGSLERDQKRSARNQLAAFENQVDAFEQNGALTSDEGEELMTLVEELREEYGL